VKLKLEHLESGQRKMRTEIKDLSNKMEKKFEHVDRKLTRRTARLTVCCTVLSLVLLDLS